MHCERKSKMLKIEHYTKIYGSNKKAVDDLCLTVEAGDLFAFIGHNGAGKTTTIRSVVGALDFDEGDILIDGLSIQKDPIACKKKMAYIPDNPDIYEYLTGIQYLNFIGDIYEVEPNIRDERIKKYAQMFEITSNLGDGVGSYSHGMKQKLVMISALLHQPKLLVLDEPFVGLDPLAAHTLKQIMHELCEQGSAIFFSTHVLDVAEKLCNKIAIIKDGKLIASGTMEEVKGNDSLENVFLELVEHE